MEQIFSNLYNDESHFRTFNEKSNLYIRVPFSMCCKLFAPRLEKFLFPRFISSILSEDFYFRENFILFICLFSSGRTQRKNVFRKSSAICVLNIENFF